MSVMRFLVPVLALAALAMPARASVVAYCNVGCGNPLSVFNSLTSGDTFASNDPITFSGTTPISQYTDGLTDVLFQATHGFTISGGVLDTQNGAGDTLTVTIPSMYTIVILTLSVQSGSEGFCIDNNCDTANLSTTPATFGYVNDNVTGDWTINISPFASGYSVAVNSFNVGPAGNDAQTPEVGTLLLIGAGLISMRWLRRLPRRFFRPARSLRTA